jgi:Protein of unknown function (DUF2505)
MAKLSVAHDYDCTATTFFRDCILSKTYNDELYAFLGFPRFEWLELREEGQRTFRRTRVAPPTGQLPAPVKKLIGDGLSYIEEGTYDATTMRFEFRVLPSALGEKADVTGRLWCTDRPGGGIVRHAQLDAHVKVFGIGSLLEEKILDGYRRSFEAAAKFTSGFLERNGLRGA